MFILYEPSLKRRNEITEAEAAEYRQLIEKAGLDYSSPVSLNELVEKLDEESGLRAVELVFDASRAEAADYIKDMRAGFPAKNKGLYDPIFA